MNVAEYLRQAMTRNPHLQVLMASGVYDLATPYFDSIFTRDHLGLPKELRGNVQDRALPGRPHDVHPQGRPQKLKKDMVELIAERRYDWKGLGKGGSGGGQSLPEGAPHRGGP